jgi:hypothetical protein
MAKLLFSWIKTNNAFLLIFWIWISLSLGCAEHSVYLIPNEVIDGNTKEGVKVDVQIRPLYTSDFESNDRKKYLFDFSSYFTSIEIQIHNGTEGLIQWNPELSLLRDAQNKEFRALNEEDAYQYYRNGDSVGDEIVLLDKPYGAQKEDIEHIKQFIMKPVVLPAGGEVRGLLLFKKISLKNCGQLELELGGFQMNQTEKSIKFRLRCPEE